MTTLEKLPGEILLQARAELPLGRRDYAAFIASSKTVQDLLKEREPGFIQHVGHLRFPLSACFPARIQRQMIQKLAFPEFTPQHGFEAVMEMVVQIDPKIATTVYEWYTYTERGAKRIEKQLAMINNISNGGAQNAMAKARAINLFKSSTFQVKIALHLLRNLRLLRAQSEVVRIMKLLPKALLSIIADFCACMLFSLSSHNPIPGTDEEKESLLEHWAMTASMVWAILVWGRSDLEGLLGPTELEMFAMTPMMEHTTYNHEAHRRFVPDTLSQYFNQIKIDRQAVKDGMPGYIPTHYPVKDVLQALREIAWSEEQEKRSVEQNSSTMDHMSEQIGSLGVTILTQRDPDAES